MNQKIVQKELITVIEIIQDELLANWFSFQIKLYPKKTIFNQVKMIEFEYFLSTTIEITNIFD